MAALVPCRLPKLCGDSNSSFKPAVSVNWSAPNWKLSNCKLLPVKSVSRQDGNLRRGLKHGVRCSKAAPAPASASASSSASAAAAAVIGKSETVVPFRIGHGFDLHRLEPNFPLIIGGINIPHDRGCEAHSDGDVLLHCIVDAILGALGLPDIGQIFPDTDPKWKGTTSSVFVNEAVRLMHEAGYELGNLDATLILERPKLSPHKEAIQANLCALLGASSSVVNIKAKTHEKVDSIGENRSIAAHTVVLLMKK